MKYFSSAVKTTEEKMGTTDEDNPSSAV